MCRLLYLPRNVRPEFPILKDWLIALEKANGGDGCGYATTKTMRKGVALTPLQCARVISHTTRPVVWHTRKISCGMKTDSLCHPYEAGRNKWLVHNGHWGDGALVTKYLRGEWSDTAVAALHCKLYGWKSFTKNCHGGVWLLLGRKGLHVHYQSGQLYVEINTGALCSQPCAEWGIWKPAAYGTYAPDETVDVREIVKAEPVSFSSEDETMDWLREKVDWRTQLFRGAGK